jgi:hypothetical protein
MNPLLSTLFLILSSTLAFAGDGNFVTQVIHESDPPFSIVVPSNKFLRITNFIQEGQTLQGNPPMEVNGEIFVFQGLQGLSGARVLYSERAGTTHQVHEDVYLAGPIVLYVAPVPNLTLVLSYLRGSN